MKIVKWVEENISEVAEYLLSGKVVVLPTDTIYGLVAVAKDKTAVERVYSLKSRNPAKKCIVLISGLEDLRSFSIKLTPEKTNNLEIYWPGKVSVELPCQSTEYEYLLKGTKSLSFRFPKDDLLCKLIKITGPLIAPSANPEGLAPASNTRQAVEYFGNGDLMYVDGGEKISAPSTLISLLGDSPDILRG